MRAQSRQKCISQLIVLALVEQEACDEKADDKWLVAVSGFANDGPSLAAARGPSVELKAQNGEYQYEVLLGAVAEAVQNSVCA